MNSLTLFKVLKQGKNLTADTEKIKTIPNIHYQLLFCKMSRDAQHYGPRFEVLTVVKMSMVMIWLVMQCGLHRRSSKFWRNMTLKMEMIYFTEILITTYKTTWQLQHYSDC
jgi:hypothetical protein